MPVKADLQWMFVKELQAAAGLFPKLKILKYIWVTIVPIH
jgi:hypothetical protein